MMPVTVTALAVATVGSAEEALEHLHAEPVDVVVLDVKMPGMDGITALGMIMKDCPAPAPICDRKSFSETTPATLPSSSSTGTPEISFSASKAATAIKSSPGWTQRTGVVMISLALTPSSMR